MVEVISNLHLQMIKPAVVLKNNLRVKNAKPVGVTVSLQRDVMTSWIGNTNTEKKIAKYISSLKHRIKVWTRCRGKKRKYNHP